MAHYLHRDGHLEASLPELQAKLIHTMRSQPGDWGDPTATLQVRCIELHSYAVGGGLTTPGHRDNGSVLTMSILLSHPRDVRGGEFVTYMEGLPIVHTPSRGGGLLIHSEKLHNVAVVSHGLRHSLVIELWAQVRNTRSRFA